MGREHYSHFTDEEAEGQKSSAKSNALFGHLELLLSLTALLCGSIEGAGTGHPKCSPGKLTRKAE